MDVYDIVEECLKLMDGMSEDKLLDATHRWFGGKEVYILRDICQDGLFESADKDPERVQNFYEYLQTTFGKTEEGVK